MILRENPSIISMVFSSDYKIEAKLMRTTHIRDLFLGITHLNNIVWKPPLRLRFSCKSHPFACSVKRVFSNDRFSIMNKFSETTLIRDLFHRNHWYNILLQKPPLHCNVFPKATLGVIFLVKLFFVGIEDVTLSLLIVLYVGYEDENIEH